MEIIRGKNSTLVQADKDKFLTFKVGEKFIKIGKPIRIIFDNSEELPEIEEKDIIAE